MFCNVNTGTFHMAAAGNYSVSDGTVTFIVPSTTAPSIYTGLQFIFTGGVQRTFLSLNNTPLEACAAGPGEIDTEAPTMVSAQVVDQSVTAFSVSIAVSATDNVEVTGYQVVDASKGYNRSFSAVSPLNITGLAPNTSYSFSIKAKDAVGNMSATPIVVNVTTDALDSHCSGTSCHFAVNAEVVAYKATYNDGQLMITLKSLTGHDLDFAEIQIVGKGGYGMTADGEGGYYYTRSASVGEDFFLRFLYSDTEMGGNEMTAMELIASDPRIIYFRVGDCESNEVTMGPGELITYSAARAFEVTDAEVYKAAVSSDAIVLTKVASGQVPAGTGVIIYSAEATTAVITPIQSATAIADNDLQATTAADGSLVAKPAGDVYVLGADNYFHPYNGSTFAPNKAFIVRPAALGAPQALRVIFETETATAIENVEAEQVVKFVENGHLIIIKNGVRYNALGQVVR